MDLYDLRSLFIDDSQQVRVYDISDDCELLFEGAFYDLPDELECYEVSSLDNIFPNNDGYIGINIELN